MLSPRLILLDCFNKINKLIHLISVVILLFFQNNVSFAQNLESFKTAKPFVATGSVFVNAFNINNANSSIPSFGYSTGINLNFSIYENFNIPLSLSYSNRGTEFNTVSFKRLGISPIYKWVKVHAGYRSYLLNQFLLSGKTIIGGGIELTPKKFHCLVFAGKVDDPYSIGNDYIFSESLNQLFYKRWMYGGKISFGPSSNRISISGVRTYDKSIPKSDTLVALGITPRDNFALALELNTTFFKILTFEATVATSALTSDRKGKPVNTDENTEKWINNLSFLLDVNQTTRWGFAGNAKLGLQLNTFRIGLKYENTQPHYTVLGVSFIQNNFENYLIDLSGTLFKKLNIYTSFGLNYVNKTGFTGKPQRRTVINANINWPVTNTLTLNGNYTNFVQKPQPTFEQVLDTFAITANNIGYNVGVNYKIGDKKSPHSINAYYTDMSFDILGFDKILSANNNKNTSLTYKYNMKDKLNYGGGLQYNTNLLSESITTVRYGLLGHIQKNFKNNISLKLDGGFRINKTNNLSDGNVINYGISANYSIIKKHRLAFSFNQIHRNTTLLNSKKLSNLRANYYYSF